MMKKMAKGVAFFALWYLIVSIILGSGESDPGPFVSMAVMSTVFGFLLFGFMAISVPSASGSTVKTSHKESSQDSRSKGLDVDASLRNLSSDVQDLKQQLEEMQKQDSEDSSERASTDDRIDDVFDQADLEEPKLGGGN